MRFFMPIPGESPQFPPLAPSSLEASCFFPRAGGLRALTRSWQSISWFIVLRLAKHSRKLASDILNKRQMARKLFTARAWEVVRRAVWVGMQARKSDGLRVLRSNAFCKNWCCGPAVPPTPILLTSTDEPNQGRPCPTAVHHFSQVSFTVPS